MYKIEGQALVLRVKHLLLACSSSVGNKGGRERSDLGVLADLRISWSCQTDATAEITDIILGPIKRGISSTRKLCRALLRPQLEEYVLLSHC